MRSCDVVMHFQAQLIFKSSIIKVVEKTGKSLLNCPFLIIIYIHETCLFISFSEHLLGTFKTHNHR